jgi:hypothetical protein
MRAIFSILGLLVVVAIVGVLAKKQLGAVSVSGKSADSAQVTLPATTPGSTPQQQSQQIQNQVKQSIEASLQQARPVPEDQ